MGKDDDGFSFFFFFSFSGSRERIGVNQLWRLPERFSALAKPADSRRRKRRNQRRPASIRRMRVSSDPRPRIFPRHESTWSFYERFGSRYVSCRSRRVSRSSLIRSTILNRRCVNVRQAYEILRSVHREQRSAAPSVEYRIRVEIAIDRPIRSKSRHDRARLRSN